MDPITLSTGAVASALWEAVKWIIRMYVVKDADWSLPVKWNVVIVGVLAYLLVPVFAWLGIGSYQFPSNWTEFGRQLFVLILQLVVGMATHFIAFSTASTKAKLVARRKLPQRVQ